MFSHTPRELNFTIPVFREVEGTKRLIQRIKEFYPHGNILVVSDGTYSQSLNRYCQDMQVLYIPTAERLKLVQYGGRWLERLFSFSHTTFNFERFIVIEPDCILHRPFYFVPNPPFLAGHVRQFPDNQRSFCNFACAVVSPRLVNNLYCFKSLDDESYASTQYCYQRFAAFKHEHEPYSEEWVVSSARILSDVFYKNCYEFTSWDEVYLNFRDSPPDNADLRYAVTHPHPL